MFCRPEQRKDENMPRKFLNVEIAYGHANCPKVIDLVKEFEKAGKFSPERSSAGKITYNVGGAVSDANPVTAKDLRRLRALGARVDLK
jgi:hypothetical protein